jgi:hypothetical protein
MAAETLAAKEAQAVAANILMQIQKAQETETKSMKTTAMELASVNQDQGALASLVNIFYSSFQSVAEESREASLQSSEATQEQLKILSEQQRRDFDTTSVVLVETKESLVSAQRNAALATQSLQDEQERVAELLERVRDAQKSDTESLNAALFELSSIGKNSSELSSLVLELARASEAMATKVSAQSAESGAATQLQLAELEAAQRGALMATEGALVVTQGKFADMQASATEATEVTLLHLNVSSRAS